jgi:hypothetical protein
MFQSSTDRLRAWLKRAEDILGDEPVEAQPHPHRRPLRWERTRRVGSVPARPAHCVSPVRGTTDLADRDKAAR